ncbi:MAG: tetratricopeptide repeat protein [Planctomycetes bacterium]|nr:tetratricopeptide repeat protein [Planctomycetota bacterium]
MTADRRVVIDNRYAVVKKLGEGGMGVVYLVEDLLSDGRLVALKTLASDEVDEEAIRFFQQEFEALARLKHPNLCEVHDYGILEKTGEIYFTLEYLAGTDLFTATRDVPDSTILDDLVQVCRALEYIHSRGFIHHDIKPANVMVLDAPEEGRRPLARPSLREGRGCDEEGEGAVPLPLTTPEGGRGEGSERAARRVKLMDFGLVREESSRKVGEVRGTLHYIAPELLDGSAVDRRADLYSLGILLYKIVRGKVPVEDRPTQSAADFYYGLLPRPPTDVELAVLREPFRTIASRLLRVNPAERYPSANQVIEEVNRFVAEPYALETKATRQSYVLSTRLVGREKERKTLTGLLAEFQQDGLEQPFWVLVGESGIGKSRLVREFRIQCQLEGVPFFYGDSYERGGEAYGPFRAVLREVVSMLGPGHATVKAYARSLSRLVPEIVRKEDGADARGAEAEGGEAKIRFLDDVSSFLFEAAKARPFVLCLQDTNWAGAESLELLKYLVRSYHLQYRPDRSGAKEEAPGSSDAPRILDLWERGAGEGTRRGPRLLVLATCRSEELAGSDVASLLEDLDEDGYVSRLELSGFSAQEIGDFLAQMFSLASPPVELAVRLHEATDGNPFFIEEVMKSLVDGNRIVKEAGKWRLALEPGSVSIPASLEEVLLRRFERFDADRRRLLSVMAVYGRPVSLADLGRLVAPWRLAAQLLARDLERKLVLARTRDEEGVQLQFHHGAGREVLYKSIPEGERRDLHRHIAGTLEAAGGEESAARLDDLAYHYRLAGERAKAVHYNRRAGDRNRDLYAYRKALDLYQQVLDLAGDDPGFSAERGAALQDLAEVAKKTGDYALALSRLEAFLGASPEPRDRVWAHRLTGEILAKEGDYDGALSRFEAARASLEGAIEKEPRTLALLELNTARVFELKGEYEKARAHGEAGLWVTGLKGLWRERGAALSVLGNISWCQGDVDGALRYHERCLSLHDERESPYGMAVACNNIGILYHEKGETEKALASYGRSLALYDRIGSPAGMALCYSNIGIVYEERGQREQAIEYHRRAVEILRRIGDRTGEARTLECLAAVYGAMGQWNESERNHRECLEICKRIGNTPLSIYAYLNLGENYLRMGALDRALEYVDQGIRLARATGARMLEGVGEGLLGEALRRRKDFARSRTSFETAVRLFQESQSSTELTKVRVRYAALLLEEGEIERAREMASGSYEEARAAGNRETSGQAAMLLAQVEERRGDRRRALELLEEAAEVGNALALPVFNWVVHHLLGRLLAADGHVSRAKEAYLRAVEEARAAWERIPPDLKEEFLADPRHLELSRDIRALRERLGSVR